MWDTLTYLQRYSSLESLARAQTDKLGSGIVAVLSRSTGLCMHLHEAGSTSFTSLYNDLPHCKGTTMLQVCGITELKVFDGKAITIDEGNHFQFDYLLARINR